MATNAICGTVEQALAKILDKNSTVGKLAYSELQIFHTVISKSNLCSVHMTDNYTN